MYTEYSNSNNKQKEYLEKLEILKIFLPTELAIKIIKLSYTYFNCCYCKHLFCREHTAIDYEHYGIVDTKSIILCSTCIKYHIGYI